MPIRNSLLQKLEHVLQNLEYMLVHLRQSSKANIEFDLDTIVKEVDTRRNLEITSSGFVERLKVRIALKCA